MIINMFNSMMMFLITSISIMISVAFLTLMERKILGYTQFRKGPNKVMMVGIMQPFSDVIKLFIKESVKLKNLNYCMYIVSPMYGLILMLLCWISYMYNFFEYTMGLGMLFLFTMISMGVYMIMLAGWSSNSLYSMLGSIRSIIQTISYEIVMILLIILELLMIESFMLMKLSIMQNNCWFIFMNFIIFMMLYISILAELNRTPFDLTEGESELVSGFNVEYMSGKFALIFMVEYGMILFFMYLFKLMFMGGMLLNFMDILVYLILTYMVILMRASFPRMRYDKLMYLIWKSFLPFNLNYYMLMFMMKFFLEMNLI